MGGPAEGPEGLSADRAENPTNPHGGESHGGESRGGSRGSLR
jgi:hypothetical protein